MKTRKILISLLALIIFMIMAVFFYFAKNKQSATVAPGDSEKVSDINLEQMLSADFSYYKIEKTENYEDMEKVTANLVKEGDISMPTTTGKATVFVKDGKVVSLPESYLVSLVKTEGAGQDEVLVSSKFYETFDKFGESSKYENVYIVSLERKDSDSDVGPFGQIKYHVFVFDKYANKIFSSYSTEDPNG